MRGFIREQTEKEINTKVRQGKRKMEIFDNKRKRKSGRKKVKKCRSEFDKERKS